jgi:hypothetical protein
VKWASEGNAKARARIMQSSVATKRQPVVPGVIDTIADGLTVALTYPLLMTVPVMLDAYFWLGWRLTPAPLIEPIKRWFLDTKTGDTQATIDALDHAARSDMMTLTAQFVPALLPGIPRQDIFEVWSRPDLDLRHWWIVSLAFFAIIVFGAGILAAYYVPLADAAMRRRRPLRRLPGSILTAWVRILGLIALLIGLFALVLGPPAVLLGVAEAFGIGLSVILIPIIVMVGAAMIVALYFSPEAIVVAEVGPLRAMYLSVNVVRRNVRQTLGLILASTVITTGLGEIWQRLAETPPGLLTAVIANAFFAGGMATAGMIFFNNRLGLLPQRSTPQA